MTGELGQLALCLALALALVQALSGFIGAAQGNIRLMAMTRGAAMGAFVFTALAFFVLMFAYVTSDFSVLAVAQNSHTTKPLIYKISGVWGNHEGSMLLWLLILKAKFLLWMRCSPDNQHYHGGMLNVLSSSTNQHISVGLQIIDFR
jgi:cytochrome c-type biogenesis protein CcmF